MAQRFNSDFKSTIVDLYNSGKGPTELSREYGISVATVYKWINKNQEIKVDSETITNDDVIALKREIARLKEENEILKKATAIFAKRN
jgi:transposase